MADYREISQQYAQGGIKSCILINAGAAVALLSQATDLVENDLADEVIFSMVCWSVGVAVGVILWLLAFVSTRFVDKSIQEPEREQQYIAISNRYMIAGEVCMLICLALFLTGCVALAYGLGSLDSRA